MVLCIFRQSLGKSILFIMQALAQDQLRALLTMTKDSDVILKMGVYDGDTSEEDRIWLRDNARLVFFQVLVILDRTLFLCFVTSPYIMLNSCQFLCS